MYLPERCVVGEGLLSLLISLELGFISLNFPALTVWINHQVFLVQ